MYNVLIWYISFLRNIPIFKGYNNLRQLFLNLLVVILKMASAFQNNAYLYFALN